MTFTLIIFYKRSKTFYAPEIIVLMHVVLHYYIQYLNNNIYNISLLISIHLIHYYITVTVPVFKWFFWYGIKLIGHKCFSVRYELIVICVELGTCLMIHNWTRMSYRYIIIYYSHCKVHIVRVSSAVMREKSHYSI